MRVIAGSARSMPLKTVSDDSTRPILDRLKKSLFSILDSAGLLVDARVLDLYAGTGIQGIEALSRGAEHCLFVEKGAEQCRLMKENLQKTRLIELAEVRATTVLRELQRLNAPSMATQPFDLILYDPPFAFSQSEANRGNLVEELGLAGGLLYPHGRLVLRTEKQNDPPEKAGPLKLVRRWTDGKHALCFYGIPESN